MSDIADNTTSDQKQLDELRNLAKIADTLGLRDYLGSAYVPVGDPKTKIKQKWYEYLYHCGVSL